MTLVSRDSLNSLSFFSYSFGLKMFMVTQIARNPTIRQGSSQTPADPLNAERRPINAKSAMKL
jgi:hypothetical protein